MSAAAHGRSPEWAEGQRLACVGARGRPLRLGLRCLSLQFTSPSARFCVATFISGSKVLHTLAPWWSGTRRYTYWGSAVFLLFSESTRCSFFPVSLALSLLPIELGTGFPTAIARIHYALGRTYGSKKKRNFVVCAAGAGSVDIPSSLLRRRGE